MAYRRSSALKRGDDIRLVVVVVMVAIADGSGGGGGGGGDDDDVIPSIMSQPMPFILPMPINSVLVFRFRL